MAFAVFYNLADLQPLAAGVNRGDLTGADRTLAGKIWNGGLRDYLTAPVWTGPQAGGDPDCRIIVINAAGVTAADMIGLLNRVSLLPGATFLAAIAKDMRCWASPGCSGAREPWP